MDELIPGTLVYEQGYPYALSIYLRTAIDPEHGKIVYLLPLDNIKPGKPEVKWTYPKYIRIVKDDHPLEVHVKQPARTRRRGIFGMFR